jgi:hypothetical protein
MKQEIIQNETSSDSDVFSISSNGDYRQCPYCPNNTIPFKLGVCICGNQVGDIQYVQNPKTFAKNYYSNIGIPQVEKMGIAELMDN